MKPFHDSIRFCPKCGVASLERDFSHQAPPQPGGGGVLGRKQIKTGTEWWCVICGFSFCIKKSVNWETAEQMFSAERKSRNGVKFTEECVGTEIATAFLLSNEP